MSEKIWIWIAWRLPRPLVYWCAVRLGAYSSVDPEWSNMSPTELKLMDALETWKQVDRELK